MQAKHVLANNLAHETAKVFFSSRILAGFALFFCFVSKEEAFSLFSRSSNAHHAHVQCEFLITKKFFLSLQTLSVLNPFRTTEKSIFEDTDLAGPLVFCLAFGGFLLLVSSEKLLLPLKSFWPRTGESLICGLPMINVESYPRFEMCNFRPYLLLFSFQSGKVTFSYIYGIGVLGCLAFYCLLSLMAVSNVTLGAVISVLGYCLLPMVVLSGINVLITIQ